MEQSKSKLKAHPDYDEDESDIFELMNVLETLCENEGELITDERTQTWNACKQVYCFEQTEDMTLSEYHREFKLRVKVAQRAGGRLFTVQHLFEAFQNSVYYAVGDTMDEYDILNDTVKEELMRDAAERQLAVGFILNSSDSRFGEFKRDRMNSISKGGYQYPTTIDEARTEMEKFKPSKAFTATTGARKLNPNRGASVRRNGHLFTTNASEGEREGKDYQCWNCDRWNECKKYNCPHTTKENGSPTRKESRRHEQEDGKQLFNEGIEVETDRWEETLEDDPYTVGFGMNIHGITKPGKEIVVEDLQGNDKHVFNRKSEGRLSENWILLDNCSTVHVFYNGHFLKNIREAQKTLHLYTNAGKVILTKEGDLPGFGPVWYHPNGIANVLSFNGVSRTPGYKVEYQSWVEDAFVVTNAKGHVRKFTPCAKGLYHWKAAGQGKKVRFNEGATSLAIVTVAENKQKHSNEDVRKAERAMRLQHCAGYLGEDQLMQIARKNHLMNSPVTPRCVGLKNRIFGASIPGLQGRTVRKNKDPVDTEAKRPLTLEKRYLKVTLFADIMFVNGIAIVTTLSKHLHFGTAESICSMRMNDIGGAIQNAIIVYGKRGFTVTDVIADRQFTGVEPYLRDYRVNLNLTGRDEHVPQIERYHRVIKERARSAYHNTPFEKLPNTVVVELIQNVVFFLNGFPWTQGISQDISPLEMVTGYKLDYNKHCQFIFGEYAQAREETTNTLKKRTTGAIIMRPINNAQGSIRLYNLATGRIIIRNRNDIRCLPMPINVIEMLNQRAVYARTQGIDGLLFTDQTGDPDDDEPDDPALPTTGDDHDADEDHTAVITGVTPVDRDESEEAEPEDIESDDPLPDEPEETETENIDEDIPTTGAGEIQSEDDEPQRSSYGRTIRSTQDNDFVYQHLQNTMHSKEQDDYMRDIINGQILTQYSLAAGLKKWPEQGKRATIKELKQMLSRVVFKEISYLSLSEEDKRNALPILIFLSEKRDGTIKTRACADGRKEKIWTRRIDASSPTLTVEALYHSLGIDAKEDRDVATCDLPGCFLQTPMEGRIILRIDGEGAKMLVELDPTTWKKHLQIIRGRPVIFVLCDKAIYGTVKAALLSYRKLTGHLTDWGFEMNPYDPCCWNKMIKNNQVTVVFHVDDLKISCKDPSEVTDVIKKLESIYATIDPMTIKRGKIHQYLGMTLDFKKQPGSVWITMYDYIRKMLKEVPDEMRGTRATAAPGYLFKVDNPAPKLNKAKSELFHHLTAQMLYLGKRGRPDVQLGTAFLTTRVRSPDENDYKKLTHQIRYLRETEHLPLIIKNDGSGTKIYIDGAHAVHNDMKGHAGVWVTEGTGTIYASSTKNKLNVVSSTEAEIVSVGEKLPKHIWYRKFRIEQGGSQDPDVLYQDNESAILMENHGRISVGKGSKHIDIRYFFVTDRVKRKEISIRHCPTKEMVADFFTKPLQGEGFHKLRNMVLGISETMMETYREYWIEMLEVFGLNGDEPGS